MKTIKSVLDATAYIVLFILFLLLLGQVVKVFSPLTTLLFVFIGTGYGLMAGWLRALVTVSGIVMYALSWVAFGRWDWSVNEATLLCGGGVIVWIIGVFVPAANHLLPLIFAARQRPM